MITVHERKQLVAIYVDRSSRQWVVRDPAGNFWLVPSAKNAWELRQPFALDETAEVEIVPGHYKYMLDLPF